MLTARAWWFLIAVLVQLGVGLFVTGAGAVGILGLTLLGWFLYEWLRFALRVRLAVPAMRVRRFLSDGRRRLPMVWAGSSFDVTVRVTLDSPRGLPYVVLQDRLPGSAEFRDGDNRVLTSLTEEDVAEIVYRLRAEHPGELRFDGVRVQVADVNGFFYHRTFVRAPAAYLVLPALADDEGKHRTAKQHNLLPPPGVHRLHRPGGGSELLDLRDYRPGDPPKMIAWKPSARRDRLITKEFESEVPVRCTFFVDASQSVRLGPPGETSLARVVELTAAAAQAASGNRDHVGLVIFDEQGTEILAPARSRGHLIAVLHRLARAAARAPETPAGDIDDLVRLALPVAAEVYPDLMRPEVNRTPWRMFWLPLFDSRAAWLVVALFLAPLLALWPLVLRTLADVALAMAPSKPWFWALLVTMLLLPPFLGLVIWFGYGIRGFFTPRQPRMARRKRIAALFAALDRDPAGTVALLEEDDALFAARLQRFLAEHQVRYPVPLYDPQGRFLFRSEGKVDVLAKSLLRSVLKGRDNELFVILADLFELDDQLDPLLRAVRVALAKHHSVLVVCPWLPGVPPPGDEPEEAPPLPEGRPSARKFENWLMRDAVARYHRAYHRVRRAFGRLGVMVVRSDSDEPVRLVLDRLDRLRGLGGRRR